MNYSFISLLLLVALLPNQIQVSSAQITEGAEREVESADSMIQNEGKNLENCVIYQNMQIELISRLENIIIIGS